MNVLEISGEDRGCLDIREVRGVRNEQWGAEKVKMGTHDGKAGQAKEGSAQGRR